MALDRRTNYKIHPTKGLVFLIIDHKYSVVLLWKSDYTDTVLEPCTDKNISS